MNNQKTKDMNKELEKDKRKVSVEYEDAILERNGFKVVIGTNTCFFHGIYFHRKDALMLSYENMNRIKI